MKDAYTGLFEKLGRDTFFSLGMEEIIFIEENKIKQQWTNLKNDLFYNNKTVHIRGYGRDGKKTEQFIEFYKILFGNEHIIRDPTNNARPTKLLSTLTGYCKRTADGKKHNVENIINYQVSHLFGKTKNPLLFNCAWNLAYIPKYLDPFTGHETQGDDSKLFKDLMLPKLKKQFNFFIEDYNSIIENKVLPVIENSLSKTCEKLELNANDSENFKNNCRKELSKI